MRRKFLAGTDRDIEVVKVPVAKGLVIDVEYPEKSPGDRKLADDLHIKAEMAAAMRRCKDLIEQHRSTLFFVNTRDTAEFLS